VTRRPHPVAAASDAAMSAATARIGLPDTKTILHDDVFSRGARFFTRAALPHRDASFIFSLTFIANNLIKGTQPRSRTSGAKFDVKGESLNEERNQEKGAREKEGCPEEEKVARALYKSEFQIHGPEQSGPFFFVPRAIGAVFHLCPEQSGPFFFAG
jgi:hypothetical protein